MNTENFLELMITNPITNVHIAKTSIAAVESTHTGCIVTLKEKRPDGTQISFNVSMTYSSIVSEIDKWEKIKP